MTFIVCIDVLWEAIQQLHRVLLNTENIPFVNEKSVFQHILLYNGKRGKLKLKYFFYVFYPAHILVLYLIQIGLGKYLLK